MLPIKRIAHPRTPGMNLTPLIDVIFILLIFFMITMEFKERTLPLQLPEVQTAGQSSSDRGLIRLSLRADRQVELEGRIVPRSELSQLLEARQQSELELAVDKSLDFEFVLQILQQVRDAGVEHVQFPYETLNP